MFAEPDVVVVSKLLVPSRRVDGTQGCVRQPCLGDDGTVVHVLARTTSSLSASIRTPATRCGSLTSGRTERGAAQLTP
jgi:hypothetical protein